MKNVLLVALALCFAGCEQPQAPAPKPVVKKTVEIKVLAFYAKWCRPCRLMAPDVRKLARDGYKVRYIDIDEEPSTAAKYGVSSPPVVVVLRNGKEAARISQRASYEELKDLVNKAKAKPKKKAKQVSFEQPHGRWYDRIPPNERSVNHMLMSYKPNPRFRTSPPPKSLERTIRVDVRGRLWVKRFGVWVRINNGR